ncbi:MAG: hypothetical protein J6Y35_03890 [Bacteroidales bacterium]|nr:hypothetical protein [Bacteroidales bacterium]
MKYGKYVLLALAAYLIYKKLKKTNLFGVNKSQSEITRMLEEDESLQVQGTATLSEHDAAKVAETIKNAWGVFNDDEEAIYSAFRRIRNLADLLLVIEKYGYYQSNALNAAEDLPTSLQKRLSRTEREKVNKILSERGIDYAF